MMQQKNGFTLIELVTVIAIMGILAGIAAPQMLNVLARHNLHAAALEVTDIMRKARSKAIREQRQVIIQFDLGSRDIVSDDSYIFDAEGSRRKAGLHSSYGGVHIGFGSATKGAAESGDMPVKPITFAGCRIFFNSMGLGNAGYVYLANNKGEAYAVGIRSTGVLMCKKWTGRAWK